MEDIIWRQRDQKGRKWRNSFLFLTFFREACLTNLNTGNFSAEVCKDLEMRSSWIIEICPTSYAEGPHKRGRERFETDAQTRRHPRGEGHVKTEARLGQCGHKLRNTMDCSSNQKEAREVMDPILSAEGTNPSK